MDTNTITGGGFQDIIGTPLSDGYLIFMLDVDSLFVSDSSTAIVSGLKVRVDLDSSGNVVSSPSTSIITNDSIVPATTLPDNVTFFTVSAFTSAGQCVWGPNPQQVLSSPSPFDIGTWIPGFINN